MVACKLCALLFQTPRGPHRVLVPWWMKLNLRHEVKSQTLQTELSVLRDRFGRAISLDTNAGAFPPHCAHIAICPIQGQRLIEASSRYRASKSELRVHKVLDWFHHQVTELWWHFPISSIAPAIHFGPPAAKRCRSGTWSLYSKAGSPADQERLGGPSRCNECLASMFESRRLEPQKLGRFGLKRAPSRAIRFSLPTNPSVGSLVTYVPKNAGVFGPLGYLLHLLV